jgi:hypothetical protein
LEEDIKRFDYPIVCGWCNLNQKDPYLSNICIEGVSEKRDGRLYKWLRTDDPLFSNTEPIPVRFAGFPLTYFRRDVVEKIHLEVTQVTKMVAVLM